MFLWSVWVQVPLPAPLLKIKKEINQMATKSSKVVKKIPPSECGTGVVCKTQSGKIYKITQNPDKGKHTLWKPLDDGYEKLATADSPYDLYEKIDWEE